MALNCTDISKDSIIIIGAGPVGCYTAKKLAEAGRRVRVYEEHLEIGRPVQCTGLLTKEIFKIMELPGNIICNEIKTARIIGKDSFVDIPLHEYVINRESFDQFLAKSAQKAGAEIITGCRFIGYSNNKVILKTKEGIKKRKAPIIIGADGPHSKVAKIINQRSTRSFYIGMQSTAKLKTDGKTLEVYLDGTSPDFFSWVVPESKTVARVGIASQNNPKKRLHNFLTKRVGKDYEQNITSITAGLIPIFNPQEIIQSQKQLFLVGDAATQVKASTGGGIVPGLKASEILSREIISGRFQYSRSTTKLRRELRNHLLIRKTLNNFSPMDYQHLIRMIDKPRIKKILENHSRDRSLSLLYRIIANEPRLIRFIPKAIRI